MDYYNNNYYIDLDQELPSDAFETDDNDLDLDLDPDPEPEPDFDEPESVIDYAGWEEEQHHARLAQGVDYSDLDSDLEVIEQDYNQGHSQEDQEDEADTDHYEADDADVNPWGDSEAEDDEDVAPWVDIEAEDNEEDVAPRGRLEPLQDDPAYDPNLPEEPLSPDSYHPDAVRGGFQDFLDEHRDPRFRPRPAETRSGSLFVDQGRQLLPPLESLLSSVRRSAHFIDLLQPEAHRAQSPLGSFGRPSAAMPRENQRQNNRHHPYAMPQDNLGRRGGGGLVDHRGFINAERLRDELVAMEVLPARAAARRNRPSPRLRPEVIDLTGEPDSPGEPSVIVAPRPPRVQNASQSPGRNPRRQMSLNRRTPSLARSDGSFLGNNQNVIDLTLDDSPAPLAPPPPLPQQLPRRNNHLLPNPHHHHRHNHHHHLNPHRQQHHLDGPPGIGARIAAGLFRSIDLLQHRLGLPRHDVEVQFLGGHGLNMDNPLADNIPDLNYGNAQNAAAAVPKEPRIPVPPAREGFTRDTGGDDEFVCPGCERDLVYDPDEEKEAPPPTKKRMTRRDQAEHHFWALKDCGHVSWSTLRRRCLLLTCHLSLQRSTAGTATRIAAPTPRTRIPPTSAAKQGRAASPPSSSALSRTAPLRSIPRLTGSASSFEFHPMSLWSSFFRPTWTAAP